MKNLNGQWQAKNSSKALAINTVAIEVFLLALLGAFAIALRANLRIPLNIPGHHGLEVMAILLIGRSASKMSMASSVSTLAAALLIFFPFMGFKDPFLPVIYILMGAVLDFTYLRFKNSKPQLFFFALIGGLTYCIIPISRLIIHFTFNYPYQTVVKSGYILPVFSHFIFGSLGALLAAALIYSTKRLRK